MKLDVFNGSPRGKNSNSSRIISWLEEGLRLNDDSSVDVYYLNQIKEQDSSAAKVSDNTPSILIFPLYADSMPGLVMAFIEKLAPLQGRLKGKKLGFIVHSGFPEATHCRQVERYLVLLCERLGADYMGTAVMGNSEGFRMMPESMTKKQRLAFNELGKDIIRFGRFQKKTLEKIAGPEKYSLPIRFIFRVGSRLGLTNMYWNYLLKQNNAFDKRFAKPYI